MEHTKKPVWFKTGSYTGFGRELSKLILLKGWNAVIMARKTDKISDIADGYIDSALVLELDVNNKEQLVTTLVKAQAKFGKIDVLVNNAGYSYFLSIKEAEEEKMRAQFETNFSGL